MRQEILRLQNLQKNKGINIVFDHFHMNIFKAEIVGLVGCALTGKTTLTDILTGKEDFLGKAFFDEQPVKKSFKKLTLQLKIAGIYKSTRLIPALTIAENIFVITPNKKSRWIIHKKKINDMTQAVLDFFQLNVNSEDKAAYLSVPMQHLISMIKFMIHGTKLIVIDDITSDYSTADIELFNDVLKYLKNMGIAILYISQNIDNLSIVSDRIVILRNGRNVKTYRKEDGFLQEEIRKALVGNLSENTYSQKTMKIDKNVMKINFLQAGMLRIKQLEICQGEILGVFDPQNKYNLMLAEILAGRRKAEEINIEIDNRPVQFHDVKSAMKLGIGMLPEDYMIRNIFNSMSLLDNIIFLLYGRYKKSKMFINQQYIQMIEKEIFEKIELQEKSCKYPIKEYNFYTQQKALLTRWLLFNPKVLICVNPMLLIGEVSHNIMQKFFDKLVANRTAVIIISSDLTALHICDRIIDLSEGSV